VTTSPARQGTLAAARPGAAFAFRFGPDRLAVRVRGDGSIEPGEQTPFHGIISRGLLAVVRGSEELAAAWARHAHRLHAGPDGGPADGGLRALREAARACGVLGLGHSAACAREYVARYCWRSAPDGPAAVELWNLKEGHTSSVWHVAVRARGAARPEEFVVNVARDAAAGEELLATSRAMRRIARAWPGANMARVLDVAAVDPGLPGMRGPVPVTRNEWVADSHEIHRLGCAAPGEGGGDLVLVERFVARPGEPWRTRSIVGRRLDAAQRRRVEDDVRRFEERVGERFAVGVDLGDGDVVWNGKRAIVVAVAERAGGRREAGGS
jgi:hypothetical protein